MLSSLKRLIPLAWLDIYHRALSALAAFYYGFPSEEMIIIGVTGTNGKTTTSYLIAKALEAAGAKTGCTTTAIFKVGTREWLNDRKMTMLGRFALQRLLRQMVREGCRYAVIETSSQGIVQHRHRHINYDVAVFTNLTPEHIEAHGSFEAYKAAKIELFRHLTAMPVKTINGVALTKTAILNQMSEHAKDFALPMIPRIVWYGIGDGEGLRAHDLLETTTGVSFTVEGRRINLHLPGSVNIENALAAYAVATTLNLPPEAVAKRLEAVANISGRFERIDEGQPFTVIVDYAYEPAALSRLYEAIRLIPHERLIHVFGSCGGGRDQARRPILGRMAAKEAQELIITNEDPYDDDPLMIIEEIAQGAREAGAEEAHLKCIPDRREAIRVALMEAKKGDLVLLTGKGSEQAIMGPNGSRTPWDERTVVRELLRGL